MAQRFDARRLALEGEPVMLADDVRLLGGAAAQAVVSASGDVLVLQRGQVGSDRKLVWRDRAGKALGTLETRPATRSRRLSRRWATRRR